MYNVHLNQMHHMSSLHVVVIQCSRQLTVSILADAQSKLCNSNNIQFVISDETQRMDLNVYSTAFPIASVHCTNILNVKKAAEKPLNLRSQ